REMRTSDDYKKRQRAVCSACLPDECHITGPRCSCAVVYKDRVYAGHLDVHLVVDLDVHDVGSWCGSESRGDVGPKAGRRFQADPIDAIAGNMLQSHLTYSAFVGAGAHD